MVNVTLDVTGMYFSEQIDVPTTCSVKDVMDRVAQATLNGPKQFTYLPAFKTVNGLQREFVEVITVIHAGPAVSRQYQPGGAPPNVYKSGKYEWSDKINRDLPENIPQLIWQYYITDKYGKSKSGKFGGRRIIVPFSESNVGAPGYEDPVVFEEGDVITWRMVGIFVRKDGPRSEVSIKFAV